MMMKSADLRKRERGQHFVWQKRQNKDSALIVTTQPQRWHWFKNADLIVPWDGHEPAIVNVKRDIVDPFTGLRGRQGFEVDDFSWKRVTIALKRDYPTMPVDPGTFVASSGARLQVRAYRVDLRPRRHSRRSCWPSFATGQGMYELEFRASTPPVV